MARYQETAGTSGTCTAQGTELLVWGGSLAAPPPGPSAS